jgi:hypothetical protein
MREAVVTRLLVCGDRYWHEKDYLFRVLDRFHTKYHVDVLIEGEQRGADKMSRMWAESRHIPFLPFEADWERYRVPGRHNPAGPIRNKQMLDEGKPEYVLAFHRKPWESKGTKHMVKIAREAGIPVAWVPKYEEPLVA